MNATNMNSPTKPTLGNRPNKKDPQEALAY